MVTSHSDGADINDTVTNIIDSIQNILGTLGQIAFSLEVSEKVSSKSSNINVTLSDNQVIYKGGNPKYSFT